MISLKHVIGWSIGSLGVAILFNTQTVLLTRYMTDELGIAAGVAATLLLISKLYDAATDPLMGWITDHTKSRWGRRRPWLLVGGLGSALAFIYLFNLPSGISSIAAVFIGLIAYSTFYTIFNVPYLAMPAEMSSVPAERTRLISWRVKAIGMGQLIGASLAPIMVFWFGSGQTGHAKMALILGSVAAAALVLCFLGTKGVHQTSPESSNRIDWREAVALIRANRPFLLLILTKLLQLTATAISLASMAYFFQHGLGRGLKDLGTYFALSSIVIILIQPVWVRLAKQGGKAKLYAIAAIGFVAIALSWFWTGTGTSMTSILVRSALSGIFVGGLLLMGQSLLPDTIHYDWQQNGLRREGIFAGIYTTVEKLSFALGGVTAGFILQFIGYQSSLSGELVIQTASAVSGIYFLSVVAPAILMLLSCIPLMYYPLKESDLTTDTNHAT
ncbi:MAG TPA: glycoside-pentoside-hexuronide (GPH):cation symporter [Gammaproteobacteria bacterium]|nr:glycoside-pentoside-hexuronide (GPH):cation symporter [Gammaproteobacteria bacterium]